MALTAAQQTNHLSNLQREVLCWDYWRLGTEEDTRVERELKEVPSTFKSIQEYINIFEPLILEECAAQVVRVRV